jgi:hypothetical protein
MKWKAIYSDETELISEDDDKSFNEINQDKLVAFIFEKDDVRISLNLANGTTKLNGVPIAFKGISYRQNNRLIYVKRIRHSLGVGASSNNTEITYLIGFHFTEQGNNQKVIFYVNPDNSINIEVRSKFFH